jgi:hypothetical protein
MGKENVEGEGVGGEVCAKLGRGKRWIGPRFGPAVFKMGLV